ncbi:MAG: hypothetical protein KJN93_02210 [Alphaproteobacteria bacterium]|nr:hypothetical protein [Alphaproteobacteria bacterium]
MYRSIEVYYDISALDVETDVAALDFRNAAMHHIEFALDRQNLGEWTGAEIGLGEVNFGFEVRDFDKAEAAVRAAVKDTPYDCIREIRRFEFDESEMA